MYILIIKNFANKRKHKNKLQANSFTERGKAFKGCM